jgi:hypothetical protein
VTPVPTAGMCSVTTTQGCTSDAECPTGEFCAPPPVSSATVTFTPNTADTEDGFVFTAALAAEPTIFADGTVTINPFDPSPPPDDPVGTVVAFDVFAETALEIEVVVKLKAEAPCVDVCDATDTPLTFSIVNDPANGTLSDLIQGSGEPQRSATITYTPNVEFTGIDSFVFEACGFISGLEVCDSATATVETAPLRPLVTDQTITTESGLPVTINIGKVQALTSLGAQIAGNVADENADGSGDNHNNLPGSAPVLMAAAKNATGDPGSNGVVRMQIEWDISGLRNVGHQLQSARVVLNTQRSSDDSEDTQFFVGDPEAMNEDGLLTDDDFEMGLLSDEFAPVLVATMPVPDVPTGTEGSFDFDVLDGLKAVMAESRTFFSVQGRVRRATASCSITKTISCAVDAQCPEGESCLVPFMRGLQVRTTAAGNLAEGSEPQLEITTAGEVAAATFSIIVLPVNGILIDSQGNQIILGAVLPSTTLTYVPNAGFSGPDSFSTQADTGVDTETGLIQINVVKTCVEVGRDPDCVPGGGEVSP